MSYIHIKSLDCIIFAFILVLQLPFEVSKVTSHNYRGSLDLCSYNDHNFKANSINVNVSLTQVKCNSGRFNVNGNAGNLYRAKFPTEIESYPIFSIIYKIKHLQQGVFLPGEVLL